MTNQERLCCVAGRIFCPMISRERDSDSCLRCPHFKGFQAEPAWVAIRCGWEPKEADEIRPGMVVSPVVV
jgi:hypothetical protein